MLDELDRRLRRIERSATWMTRVLAWSGATAVGMLLGWALRGLGR